MRNNKVRNLIRMSSDIIDQKTTVTSEQISSLLACVVEGMEDSQESLVVALQEST
ncbi:MULTISPECIES: hypothetical protein [Marinomonas]|uniref:Uncharacterized protein n=1 Tax=Marinomonas arctica TaxID=383750 RepID=A0A7H1J7S9_9GAMM|nr:MULTISPECIES: hypothetical protein [Marinomonas]QNT06545.1 hypothetical protein IBG28_02495 [Marinomonas arctica]GGN35844.1 hypothetical protein GCM10011350_33510 [Marinomonas arctica]